MTENELGEIYRQTIVRPQGAGNGGCPPPDALRSVAEHVADETDRLDVFEHVSACSDCQRDLALLVEVARTRPVRRRSLVPVGWLAAAATIVLAVVGARILATRGTEAPVMRGEAPAVALVAPTGSVSAEPAPVFVWRSVDGATRYEVEVLGADAAPVATRTVRDTVLAAPDGLEVGSAYSWRVTAVRPDGTRVESLLGRFDLVRE